VASLKEELSSKAASISTLAALQNSNCSQERTDKSGNTTDADVDMSEGWVLNTLSGCAFPSVPQPVNTWQIGLIFSEKTMRDGVLHSSTETVGEPLICKNPRERAFDEIACG
jgi:hypothetical protein